MDRLTLLLATTAIAVAGCTTTSFAPPRVDLDQVMTASSLSPDCGLTTAHGTPIPQNVAGALQLIDNYDRAYDCAQRAAANGRQAFQIPSFLALVGSTTAVAFGAGADVAIAGGAANSVFTAGSNYYAPAEQNEILLHALDAINCISEEAVGSPAYASLPAAGDEERRLQLLRDPGGGQVEITSDQRYFRMVRGALRQVAIVTGQRLSRRGTFDAAGVAAQIRTLADEERERRRLAEQPPPTEQALTNRFMSSPAGTARLMHVIQLQLDLLQPKLDQCVLRAKV